jgi:hypothetical protein
MVKVVLYVEGADRGSKEQKARCREGFRKLINNAGFVGRSPRIVACGGRGDAYKDFKAAVKIYNDEYVILLVDSEDLVNNFNVKPDDSGVAWRHLKARDGWDQPSGTVNAQAQLMATCMETWVMADHTTINEFFGQYLQLSALLPVNDLENRTRFVVQDALEHATRNCGKDRTYKKGKKSFEVLGELNPDVLKEHLSYFRRFVATLAEHL